MWRLTVAATRSSQLKAVLVARASPSMKRTRKESATARRAAWWPSSQLKTATVSPFSWWKRKRSLSESCTSWRRTWAGAAVGRLEQGRSMDSKVANAQIFIKHVILILVTHTPHLLLHSLFFVFSCTSVHLYKTVLYIYQTDCQINRCSTLGRIWAFNAVQSNESSLVRIERLDYAIKLSPSDSMHTARTPVLGAT